MADASVTLPPVPFPDDLPEPPFEMGDTGRRLYAGTAPVAYADPDNEWAWARLCTVIGHMFDPIAEMVRPDASGNLGWTALASPYRCPPEWLRVLGQWAGIRISTQDAMTDSELRDLIATGAPGIWRGTRRAAIAAIRRYYPTEIAPEYLLFFNERPVDAQHPTGNPYRLTVFTYSFVEHDPDLVRAALLAAIPAGRTLTYEVRQGQAWFMLRDRMDSWADVQASYASWDDVLHDQPI